MKNLRIIPKLDIKNHNLVKGISLEGLRVLGDPKNFIENYYKNGADEIIYHDVVASLYERKQLLNLVGRTAKDTFLPIMVGGGIKNLKEINDFLESGADRVFINSAFIRNKNFVKESINYFGSSTIVCSVEALKKDNDYFCYIDFGREETKINLKDWITEMQDIGISEIIVTSIDQDGKGKGFDLYLAEILQKLLKIPYIVNGGFGALNHFDDLLNTCDPSGIALGSMLHYGFSNNPINSSEGNTSFLKNKKKFMNFGNYSLVDIKKHIMTKKNIRKI